MNFDDEDFDNLPAVRPNNDVVGADLIAQPNALTAQIAGEKAMADLKAAIFLSKQFPRDVPQVLKNLELTCSRPGIASKATYRYTKGGSDVSGATIVLMRAIAAEWGNIEYDMEQLEDTPEYATVRVSAWDTQTNARSKITIKVPHERHSKKGVSELTDPRERYENMANFAARRLRRCLENVIPDDIVKMAIRWAQKSLEANFPVNKENLDKLSAAFGAYGVNKKMLEKYLGRSLDTMSPGQMVKFREIYTSIKEEASDASDWFDMSLGEEAQHAAAQDSAAAGSATEAFKAKLKEQQAAGAAQDPPPAAKPEAATTPPPAAQESTKPAKAPKGSKQAAVDPPAAVTVATRLTAAANAIGFKIPMLESAGRYLVPASRGLSDLPDEIGNKLLDLLGTEKGRIQIEEYALEAVAP